MDYLIRSNVSKIENKKQAVRSVLVGKDEYGKPMYQVEYQNMGWFVLFTGSSEFLYLGHDKPDIRVGQSVEIILRFRE
jgi:hypothetical protein